MELDALRTLQAVADTHVAELKAQWKLKYDRSYSDPHPDIMTQDEAIETVTVICAELAATEAEKAVKCRVAAEACK